MPSRRTYLIALATAVAGCTTGPGTADGPSGSPNASRSPTGSQSRTPSDDVEHLPADDPALAWAVRLSEPVPNAPAVGPDRDRVYVGAGENSVGTATAGGGGPTGAVFGLRTADGDVAWRTSTDAPVVEAPVVHDGRVHVVTGYSTGMSGVDQRVVAHAPNGTRRWETAPAHGFLSLVAAAGGSVFVGTSDDALSTGGETLFAVGPGGDVHWEREAGDAMGGTVADGQLLYSAGEQALVSHDIVSGARNWRGGGEPLGNPTTSVAAFDGRCFTQSPEKGGEGYPLVARATADGRELWRYSTAPGSGENFVPTGVARDGDGLVGTEFGGAVYALAGDGSERWTFTADASTYDGPVVGKAVYVGDRDGTVYALSPGEGRERWRASLPRFAVVQPLSDGVLAFSRGEGRQVVASFRGDGTERWRYATSGGLTPPVVAGDRAYAGASDGTVLAFDAE